MYLIYSYKYIEHNSTRIEVGPIESGVIVAVSSLLFVNESQTVKKFVSTTDVTHQLLGYMEIPHICPASVNLSKNKLS